MDSTTGTCSPRVAATACSERTTGQQIDSTAGEAPKPARTRAWPAVLAAGLAVLVCGCSSVAGSGSDRAVSGAGCDPNYAGACLDPSSADYDCENGEGNGPDYTGPVRVVGSDPHGLDRDGDGSACEG
jgi:hypothetical protein